MKAIKESPIFTEIYSTVHDYIPDAFGTYIYGISGEERSSHVDIWKSKIPSAKLAKIDNQTLSGFTAQIGESIPKEYPLRSQRLIMELLDELDSHKVYLDVTGINNNIWAPLVKAVLHSKRELNIMYVEPSDYRPSTAPTEGEIYDLSERIQGLAPIPGFISLS